MGASARRPQAETDLVDDSAPTVVIADYEYAEKLEPLKGDAGVEA